jgi:hypothetical protein
MKNMSRWKKVVMWIVIVIVILFVLNFFGIIKVNLTQRFAYAGCDSGCNTNLNDVSDCVGFLAYLRKTDPQFVSGANTMGINLDKPDKVMKVVSTTGKITCRYYAN